MFEKINMLYRQYKQKWSHCKTCGDYDSIKRTITVMIPKEEYSKCYNAGNKYQIESFVFQFEYTKITGKHEFIRFNAKNYDNALKQAKKFAKENYGTIKAYVDENHNIIKQF